jgi:glycine amidinotransferase/scyllo-inosamine-4-phosphate amidinotransferase 1
MIYDEFTQLNECIVGTSYKTVDINGLDKVVDQTNEDLLGLVWLLEELGIKVHRPEQPEFSMDLHHPIMPRDIFGFYGDKMIQTYGAIHSRQRELECYKEIEKSHMWDHSYELIRMWKPDIQETEEYDIREAHSNKMKLQQRYDKYKDMVLWDTANFIKCGDTILHTQSADKDPENGKGTERGLEWMKSILTDYKFIEVPVGGHIDGKLALLRPGLLMTWREDFIPKELKSWDKIIITDNAKFPKEFKNTKKQRFYSDYVMKYLSDWTGHSQETWFDVNCFSVNEKTVITTGQDKENIKKLERYGIDVIVWNYRHRYFWDGGAHCCTQDTVREGTKETYVGSV